MTEIEARVAAAQATLDEFRERRFAIGRSDCAAIVKFNCRAMGCPIRGVSKAGSYRTLLGMKRALRRLGAKTIGDVVARQKGWLEIAPASCWPGDIVELEGDDGPDGIGALAVVLTNGRCVAYHADHEDGAAVIQPGIYRRAWRLPWAPAKPGKAA